MCVCVCVYVCMYLLCIYVYTYVRMYQTSDEANNLKILAYIAYENPHID